MVDTRAHAKRYSDPTSYEKVRSPNIGFLGNMGYLPNIEAVHWLYEHVFRPLRTTLGTLSLYIIGRNPVDSVKALGGQDGVTVTGEVDDLWGFVNAVDVFVFPLWRGVGIKNKVLETMYAKRAVVTTRIGSEGVGAVPGRDLLICDTAGAFRDEVRRLLHCPDERTRLGEAARKLVQEHFSWDRILSRFEAVITG